MVDDNKVVKIKNIKKGKFGDPLNLQTFSFWTHFLKKEGESKAWAHQDSINSDQLQMQLWGEGVAEE